MATKKVKEAEMVKGDENKTGMRMCLVCGVEHPIKEFGTDRGSVDGIANICLAEKYEKKNQRRILQPKVPAGATKSVMVNFEKCGCPELYETVTLLAKEQLRSPEGQIIVMLREHLKSCSSV